MLVFKMLLFSLLTAAKEIPPNLLTFYHAVRNAGPCHGDDLLKGGFFNQADGSPPLWSYCQRYTRSHGLYLKGHGDTLANMDIDCDGQNVTDDNDGRCHRSRATQFETSFRDIVRGYGYVIPDLNLYIHPYVVLGNAGGHRRFYRSFDPRTVDAQPLSLVAVVCNNQLLYGVWGDVNGDDGVLPLVGEASLALATACFGHGAVDEDTGYDGTDVLYLAFSEGEAVPGVTARWDARSFEEFEGSVEGLGDWLVRRVVSGNTSCLGV